MTNEHGPNEIHADGKELNKPGRNGGDKRGLGSALMIVLILGGAAGALYLYQETMNKADELHQSAQQFKSQIGLLQKQTASLQSELEASREKLAALRSDTTYLLNALEGMTQRPLPTDSALAIAEVEHLLIIATQRLSLSNDITTALAAMQAADMRLAALYAPGLVEVRKQLVEDMNALRSVNQVDIAGLALYLADTSKRIDGLKLKNIVTDFDKADTQDANNNERASRSIFGLLWQELKQLLVIKRRDESVTILPDEHYYIYQNLKLELGNARQAALNRDTANMKEAIGLALDWLDHYFDNNEATTRNLIDALMKMETLELEPSIPNINSSLETVRAYSRYGDDIPPAFDDTPSPTQ